MLFNSYSFLFVFLPAALAVYAIATRIGPRLAAWCLALSSLVFYGVWSPAFLLLLGGSVVFNYVVGTAILRNEERDEVQRLLLILGVTGDLSLLFFFKYFAPLYNFARHSGILHSDFDVSVVLPLGISFFTFTQIGYLVDCRQGLGRQLSFVHYVVFATFFPHLIAGPILHIREIAPQILDPATYRIKSLNLAAGFTYFVLGLSKKLLLADPISQLADRGFLAPRFLPFTHSWLVALDYAAQLYFDFSGYSDMAIGLAFMFGLKFPLNFDSPYRSPNIISYWQRFHMTLTRYLTLLLFNPFALWVTRRRMARGKVTRSKQMTAGAFASTIAAPTVYTMTLAGVWHGAGLKYLIFGLLHAFYLCVNHAWRAFGPKAPAEPRPAAARFAITTGQVMLTFVCVVAAQMFFRAGSVDDALSMLAAMTGGHGFDPVHVSHSVVHRLGGLGDWLVRSGWLSEATDVRGPHLEDFLATLGCFLIIFLAPNTQQIMCRYQPYLAKVEPYKPLPLTWSPTIPWALVVAALLVMDVLSLRSSTVFLYFQF